MGAEMGAMAGVGAAMAAGNGWGAGGAAVALARTPSTSSCTMATISTPSAVTRLVSTMASSPSAWRARRSASRLVGATNLRALVRTSVGMFKLFLRWWR
ncbi:hypothetical protein D9M68_955420 [compost metagenome]